MATQTKCSGVLTSLCSLTYNELMKLILRLCSQVVPMVTTTIVNGTEHDLTIQESSRGVLRFLLTVRKQEIGSIRVKHTDTYREFVFIYPDSNTEFRLTSDDMLSYREIEFSRTQGSFQMKRKKDESKPPHGIVAFLSRKFQAIASFI